MSASSPPPGRPAATNLPVKAATIGLPATTESTCDAGLRRPPWELDALPGYGPGASAGDPGRVPAGVQPPLPAAYRTADATELADRIRAARAALGDRLLVVGHFYQRDEIVAHADFVGDSFQLARRTTERPDARAIVFCGVHFMAETADILSAPDQAVILPNLNAGCSMADMATIAQLRSAWAQLTAVLGDEPDADGRMPLLPITYMNSSAAIKAFCGERGGIVCTSSNAATVLDWAFARARRVIFLPDQHLGRNTGRAAGVPDERMPLWQPREPLGGLTEQQVAHARIILWNGWCSVHRRFTTDQIARARQADPNVRVLVHPECPAEVVDAADGAGSTDYLRRAAEAAPPGSSLAIGTEVTLVHRLAAARPDCTITCLDPVVCPCSTMYRIHPAYLAWVLERLVAGEVVNRITVPDDVRAGSALALRRMLEARP